MSKPQVVCLGEALIDFLPAKPGQNLAKAQLLRRTAGGASANVAVGLARLGVGSAFLGKVGADPFGEFLRQTLSDSQVDVSHLLLSKETNTGLAFGWTELMADGVKEARYVFFRQPNADRMLRAAEIDREWLVQAQVLQFGSLLLSSEPSREAVQTALNYAREAGLLLCYDVNMRLPAFPDGETARTAMFEPMEFCQVVKLNRHELKFLTSETEPERGAQRLWHSRMQLLVVTLDSGGCYYKIKDYAGFLPGFVVPVVDTVGAGDAFMAGLVSKILEQPHFDFQDNNQVEAACRFGNAVGALACTKAGAIAALPTLRTVQRFLRTVT